MEESNKGLICRQLILTVIENKGHSDANAMIY